MLKFSEIVNIREVISKGLELEDSSRGEAVDLQSIAIVGREPGSIFLFVYDTHVTKESLNKRTHIGLCNITDNRTKTLFSFSKKQDILHCSVSDRNALIAFTIAADPPIRTDSSSTKELRVYAAEVNGSTPNNIIEISFQSLERYKSSQFIHSDAGAHSKHSLLLFEHGEFVGVCHFSLDSLGKWKDKSRKIQPDWIISRHLWYQWSIDKQQLYIIPSPSPDNGPCLDVWQASDKTTLEKVLSIPIKLDSRSKRPPLPKGMIEQRSLDRNIVILTDSSGLFCICNQVPYERRDMKQAEDPFTLTYEVVAVHNQATISVSIPKVSGKLRKRCINFLLLGNYIIAYLPDVFTHLINVHDGMELGMLNILSSEAVSLSRVPDIPAVLSNVHLQHIRKRLPGVLLYESQTMTVYQASVNEDSMFELFKSRWSKMPKDLPLVGHQLDISNQLAILHYTFINSVDPKRYRQLLECFKLDPTTFDMTYIFAEFIIGSSYTALCRKLPQLTDSIRIRLLLSKLLRYTYTEANKAHKVLISEESQDFVNVSIKNQPLNKAKTPFESLLPLKADNYFSNFLLLVNCSGQRRFDVPSADVIGTTPPALKLNERKPNPLKQLIGRINPKKNVEAVSSSHSGTDQKSDDQSDTQGLPDSLLDESIPADDKYLLQLSEHLITNVREKTSQPVKGSRLHLYAEECKKHNKAVANICNEYVSALMNQVKHLLFHLFKVFNLTETYSSTYMTENPEDLRKCFYVFERYQHAVLELGLPLPKEFASLFVTIAYQSLSEREFMQYLENGILQITDTLLHVLDKDTKTSLKHKIFLKLSGEQALKWAQKLHDSPGLQSVSTKLLAQSTFQRYLCQARGLPNSSVLISQNSLISSDTSEEQESGVPSFDILVEKLKSAGWQPQRNGVDLNMLKEGVFYNTKSNSTLSYLESD